MAIKSMTLGNEESSPAKKSKNRFQLKWFDWVAITLLVASIGFNVYFILHRPDLYGVLSSFLFQIINLIIGIYIAVRMTIFFEKDKKIEVQKSIAITSIRQIRSSQSMIGRLVILIDKKKKALTGKKEIASAFNDINCHLENIKLVLTDSENAFKDILGEEFKEESEILSRVQDQIRQLHEMNNERQHIQTKKDVDSKQKIDKLESDIALLRAKIAGNLSSLPLTIVSGQGALPMGIGSSSPTVISPWGVEAANQARLSVDKFWALPSPKSKDDKKEK